jgi:hypothetical protein
VMWPMSDSAGLIFLAIVLDMVAAAVIVAW